MHVVSRKSLADLMTQVLEKLRFTEYFNSFYRNVLGKSHHVVNELVLKSKHMLQGYFKLRYVERCNQSGKVTTLKHLRKTAPKYTVKSWIDWLFNKIFKRKVCQPSFVACKMSESFFVKIFKGSVKYRFSYAKCHNDAGGRGGGGGLGVYH